MEPFLCVVQNQSQEPLVLGLIDFGEKRLNISRLRDVMQKNRQCQADQS